MSQNFSNPDLELVLLLSQSKAALQGAPTAVCRHSEDTNSLEFYIVNTEAAFGLRACLDLKLITTKPALP